MSSRTRTFRPSTRRRLLSVPVAGAAALTLVLTGCGEDEATGVDDAGIVEEDAGDLGEEDDLLDDEEAGLEDEDEALEGEDDATDGGAAAVALGDPGTLFAGDVNVIEALAASDPAAELEALAGEPLTATLVPVLTVPTDEGFWIGTDVSRMWVQLVEPGESPADVDPGDLVSFVGDLVPIPDGFVEQLSLPEDQATALMDLGHYIEVPAGEVTMG